LALIKTPFEWGEKVFVTGSIKRHKQGNQRVWKGFDLEKREAIYLYGFNLVNGNVEFCNYPDDGGSLEFNPSEIVPGAWICEKNRKPRKVFLNMIIKK